MKAYKYLPTGKIYPARGSQTGFEPGRTRMKWFIVGKGWMSTPLKQWEAMDIPDLPDKGAFTVAEFRAYVQAYSIECATEFVYTCDMMKPSRARLMLDPAYPDDETAQWCIATFKLDPRSCYTPILGMFGRYSFDVFAFEDHLAKRYGYPKDADGLSIHGFMRATFGEENTERFARAFGLTNATSRDSLTLVNHT